MTDKMYPNADARPHTGDRVYVESDAASNLKADVKGTIQHFRGKPDGRRVRVRYGARGDGIFNLDAVILLEASEPRFDGFEPGVIEERELPAVRYGTYIPHGGYEGAQVTAVDDDTATLERKPSTDDRRVIDQMAQHGWTHKYTRDDAGSHGVMHFEREGATDGT